MSKNTFYLVLCCLCFFSKIEAQTHLSHPTIEISGFVLDGDKTKELPPIAYANIAVKNKPKGTISTENGFFEIKINRSDTLVFSVLGYQSVEFSVPEDLNEAHYSVVQLMRRNAIDLPEALVYPLPSKEHFKQEFLAMDVSEELMHENFARKNIEDVQTLLQVTRDNYVVDGATNFLNKQRIKAERQGMIMVSNVFNPLAWVAFIASLKNRSDNVRNKRKQYKIKSEHIVPKF